MATKKKPATKRAPAKRSASVRAPLNMYRRIAISFVLVVAAVLAVVLYVSTVRATILIKPVEKEVRAQFILDVVKVPTRESEIRGRVLSGTLGKTETFTPSGTGETLVEGTARGVVTISNTSATAQPLVATTRLLTPDGVLFRIDETVTVPAGGSVDVAAHADQDGASGDLTEAQFTIPGLNATRQKEVTATVKEAFTGGVKSIVALSKADIDSAIEGLVSRLEEDAKVMLRTEAGEIFLGESFTTTVLEQKVSAEPGDQVDAFDVELTVRTVAVFFDQEALDQIAVRQLYSQLGQGREMAEVSTDQIQISVEKTDTEDEMANLRVQLAGNSIASTTSGSLEPSRFSGMSEEEVAKTLIGDGIATDVEVEFFPFWVKNVPNLADHVYIEIL